MQPLRKLLAKKKKGAIGLNQVLSAMLILFTIGIVLTLLFIVNDDFASSVDNTSVAYSAIQNTTEGMAKWPSYTGTIVLVIVIAAILGILGLIWSGHGKNSGGI